MEQMMTWPVVGLAFGTVLGFAAAFGGFGAFFTVLILGLVGFLVGRVVQGELSLGQLFGKRS